jgi:NADH:ubiquinone reductase (H+-translocating)
MSIAASSNGDTPVTRHRTVIIGGGFAGLSAARVLRNASVDVTVVDRASHHLFQPLLYQAATGAVSEGDIAPPLHHVLRRQRNTRVLCAEVTDINLEAREVVLATIGKRRRLEYDSLIVAAGAGSSYFGHSEFAVHAPALKTIDDALDLRTRIFRAFDRAELEPRSERRDASLTFVVIGAGPAGVELAAQIAELSRRGLKDNFRSFNPQDARVIVLEKEGVVLPTFPDRLQRRARQNLQRLGVEVRLHASATGIDASGVDVTHLDGSTDRILSYTKIWAGGVQASPLGRILSRQSETHVNRAGRVSVRPDCSLPGYPEVFVVGDLMSLTRLPGVADVAVQSGRHVARTIKLRVNGNKDNRPFNYHQHATVANIGRFRAVASTGRWAHVGLVAWMIWLCTHLTRLTRFKHRMTAFVKWGVASLRRARRHRVAVSRPPLEHNVPVRHAEPGLSARRLPRIEHRGDPATRHPDRSDGTATGPSDPA